MCSTKTVLPQGHYIKPPLMHPIQMTSGELYGLIGNAMTVVTAEVIQIERRKE